VDPSDEFTVTQFDSNQECVYPVFNRTQVRDYFFENPTWVISMGSSHGQQFGINLLKTIVSQQTIMDYAIQIEDNVTVFRPVNKSTVVLINETSSFGTCFNEPDMECLANVTQDGNYSVSFFNTIPAFTYAHIVYELQTLSNLTPPLPLDILLHVEVGTWYTWIINDARTHWIPTANETVQLWNSGDFATIHELIQYDLLVFLEYLRDSWPSVKEVYIAAWHPLSLIPDNEFLITNGLPRVHVESRQGFHSIEGTITQLVMLHYNNGMHTLSLQRFFTKFIKSESQISNTNPNYELFPAISFDPGCYGGMDPYLKSQWWTEAYDICEYQTTVLNVTVGIVTQVPSHAPTAMPSAYPTERPTVDFAAMSNPWTKDSSSSIPYRRVYDSVWDVYHVWLLCFAVIVVVSGLRLMLGVPSMIKHYFGFTKKLETETTILKAKPASRKLLALGPKIFIASVHVVCGHLVRKSPLPIQPWLVSDWGYTWVPWFMMVSGFVLTYARGTSKDPLDVGSLCRFMENRLLSIYPIYITGLMIAIGIDTVNEGYFKVDPFETVASVLLLQAWIPSLTENVYQNQCWFLSCIIPYWLLHNRMYLFFYKASSRFLSILLFCCFAIPVLLLMVVPLIFGEPTTWFKQHTVFGSTEKWQDILTVMLKFHPIFYLHIYVSGMLIALLVIRFRETSRLSKFIIFDFGTTISYSLLFGLFSLSGVVAMPTAKLVCRLGGLIPLQGLLLVGISWNQEWDPLVRLFSHKLFSPLEKLSYPQYIFQFIAWNTWKMWTGVGYWMWLLALSILVYGLVQRNLSSRRLPTVTKLKGFIGGILFIAMMILVFAAGKAHSTFDVSYRITTLDFYNHGFSDKSIGLALTKQFEGNIINPSLWYNQSSDDLLVAGRKHNYTRILSKVNNTEVESWESDLVISSMSLDFDIFGDTIRYFASREWMPNSIAKYVYVANNNSFYSKVTTGFEDPRLFEFENEMMVSGTLANPNSVSNSSLMINDKVFMTEISQPQEMKMLAKSDRDTSIREKNWLAFDNGDQVLRMVTSLHPFVVVRRDAFNTTDNAYATEIESSVYEDAIFQVAEARMYAIHGGSNPVRYSDDSFVGIFHTFKDGVYLNHLFEFQQLQGSWRILRVSKWLPLYEVSVKKSESFGLSKKMTFASGLIFVNDDALISYGSSNKDARILKVSREYIEQVLQEGIQNLI